MIVCVCMCVSFRFKYPVWIFSMWYFLFVWFFDDFPVGFHFYLWLQKKNTNFISKIAIYDIRLICCSFVSLCIYVWFLFFNISLWHWMQNEKLSQINCLMLFWGDGTGTLWWKQLQRRFHQNTDLTKFHSDHQLNWF